MTKILLFAFPFLLLLSACGHKVDHDELLRDIEKHEQEMDYTNYDVNAIDSVNNMMIDLYRQFYTAFPEDSMSAEFMQRAAQMLITQQCTEEAVALLDSIVNQYPEYNDLGGCWFLKGIAYENAEQYDSARVAYTYFIENYPEHYLAESTRISLQYLGMSTEEMFDAIMNNASDKGLAVNE